MSDQSANSVARRREAGDFLRSRRERLVPSDVGLPNGIRRRTRGLRREEVAMLAGVGTTWYTWLEQGREVRPSEEVLASIAKTLKMDSAEQEHLAELYRRTLSENSVAEEQVGEPIRRMLDSMTAQPAYVLGRRWDFLAWNRAAEAVYGSYERLAKEDRNALFLVFADREHRRLLVDWEAVARASLAMFRSDYARHAGDPAFERLIQRLTQISPEFALWWSQREVTRPLAGQKRIEHPVVGRMIFEYSKFGVGDSPDLKLIVFTPLADEGTTKKLTCLLPDHDTSVRSRAHTAP